MAAQATPFESPRACPFVALEHDRDKRADQPDYRHRCFAEPTPAPRSIAHQEAYCLSPSFAACPVFQDWAVRAAARPTAGSQEVGAVGAGLAAAATDYDRDVADVEAEIAPTGPDSAIEELPEDASVTPAGAEIAVAAAAATGMAAGVAASPPTFATTDPESDADESEQLGAFDAPHPFDQPVEPHSSYGELDAGYPLAAGEPAPPPPPFVPPPMQPGPENDELGEAAAVAAPAFLAGRSSRPASTTSATGSPPPPARPPTRDEIVPSWEIDGRYGAESPPDGSGSGSRLDGVLTAIAVIAILALGVAAVLFLPGLLNGKPPARTPGPSALVSSAPATVVPGASASIRPSAAPSAAPSVPASVAPTTPPSVGPEATPRTYKIKAGDQLQRIARKFNVTVEEILAANPDIENADDIQAGQIIIIPPSSS